MPVCLSSNGQSKLSGGGGGGAHVSNVKKNKKVQTKLQTSVSGWWVRVLTESAGLGSAVGGGGWWWMRSHYQGDENSTSRISQLLCLSHGSVKLGTINS